MRPRSLSALYNIYDAVLDPHLWPVALDSTAQTLGAMGVALVIQNRQTGEATWLCSSLHDNGPSAEYLRYYGKLDPFRPICATSARNELRPLFRLIPEEVLARNEWYNDYVTKLGVGDILGGRLCSSQNETLIVGIHRHLDQGPWPQKPFDEAAARLLGNLQTGAELYCRFRFLHWKSAISDAVLSQTAAGLVITAADGRVTEINRTAEQIVSRGGGLAIRNGRLCTQRAFEEARLHKLIEAATAESEGVTAGCMLVGRHDASPPYSVTVTPLSAELAASGRPLAMVIIANLEPESPSANGLGDLFGLSPRESQLAAGLLAGKTLKDIADSSGVRIATVRSQLSSVLRKVGVERQVDLVRLLTRAQMVKLPGSK